jgi:hypothetical protein
VRRFLVSCSATVLFALIVATSMPSLSE